MKKEYKTPQAEKLDFEYSDNVTASGSVNLTDQATTNWWKCETRIVDVKNIEGTVCGSI